MQDPLGIADRYRKTAVKCRELANSATPVFAEFYRRVAARYKEAKLNFVDPRHSETDATMRSLLEIMWVMQGRVSALEIVTAQVIEEFARSHVDPRAYMQRFVERSRARLTSANTDDPTRAERTVEERNIALEEFLAVISQNAALLKVSDWRKPASSRATAGAAVSRLSAQ
jgi:hypothetical protein